MTQYRLVSGRARIFQFPRQHEVARDHWASNRSTQRDLSDRQTSAPKPLAIEEPTWNGGWHLLLRRTTPVGVLKLWWDPAEGSYHVSRDDRASHRIHRVPAERLAKWFGEFDDPPPSGAA